MVRAILDGRKTETRRIVKLPHANPLGEWSPTTIGGETGGRTAAGEVLPLQGAIWHNRTGDCLTCPYGVPGDRLWVRETHMRVPHPAEVGLTREMLPHTWDQACAIAGTYLYRADPGSELAADGMRWTPSIHMPRAASRITLEVTGVRVERLQDISEAGALAEGINRIHHGDGAYYYSAFRDEHHPKNWNHPEDAFRELWEQINGAGSWDANPWVWVVEFRRIEQEARAA